MAVKRKPHHDLGVVQVKFARPDTLEVTGSAFRDAQAIGFALEDVVEVVQALKLNNFVKSETAHRPPNSRVWHDTYHIFFDGVGLYLKFAGEALIDVVLVSFKER